MDWVNTPLVKKPVLITGMNEEVGLNGEIGVLYVEEAISEK